MKKRILGFVLMLFAVAFCCFAVGCDECEHIYDSECDTVCNECKAERSVNGHVYSFACDAKCNLCDFVREAEAHTYSGECDKNCNICMEPRVTESDHTYTAECDADCNVCAFKRTPGEHFYDNACDAVCNFCPFIRSAEAHVYDDGCDTECNVCGGVRTVNDHVYSYDCDAGCNVCGFVRDAASHAYSGDCDKSCNVCGFERETTEAHEYSADCDAECNVCGEIRTAVGAHSYSSDCDTECNYCGITRTVTKDHNWKKSVTVQRRTCTLDEILRRECRDCGAEEEYEGQKATGHIYDSSEPYIFNNDATHAKDGTESQMCIFGDAVRNTRPLVGSAGHSFGENGKCKECDFEAPSTDSYMLYESFEGINGKGQSYADAISLIRRAGTLKVETRKTGVTYTVVQRGNTTDSNIRALKIARDASQNESGNDTIVDCVPRNLATLTAKHVIEFDIMIGSSNGANIYLNGRKEKNGSAVFNQFVWYNDAYKSVLIGDTVLVDGVEDDQWYTIALVIDDEAKTYDIYVEGVKALSGISYVKSDDYYAHSDVVVGCYRFTANKGTSAVEFYLDNVTVYNGEYRAS